MPSIANIVLADAQGTPVDHTFSPLGRDANGVWWWEDRSASAAAGYWRISARLKRVPPPSNGYVAGPAMVNKVEFGIHMPILETLGTSDSGLTPPPTVAYIDRVKVEYTFADRDSLQNRKDLRKMMANSQALTDIITFVEQMEDFRG
jgi:hypothetical protein